jgi:hypothetical protein
MRTALEARGPVFGYETLQRFFARHRIMRKNTGTPMSRIGPTS